MKIAGRFYEVMLVPLLILSGISGDTSQTDMLLGISGHPLNTIAYNANSSTNPGVDYDTQVAMLKEMGMDIYRIDVYTNPSGKARNHDKFVRIVEKCIANDIRVLPMIYDRCRYDGSPEEAYREAYRQMSGFAQIYGKYFEYFELGNEMELFDGLRKRGVGNGSSPASYHMERVEIAEQYISGMEAGLKSVMPEAKSMVNAAGYFPIFWMDRMFAAAPSIDICAWHIYSEMPPSYKSKLGIENIHDYLFERYKRPIWYTETNARVSEHLSQEENDERAYEWRRDFTAESLASKHVEAVIYHELLDNPERKGFANKNFGEEHLGFVRFNGYPGKSDKSAYDAWRSDPERYQNWSYKKPAVDLIKLSGNAL